MSRITDREGLFLSPALQKLCLKVRERAPDYIGMKNLGYVLWKKDPRGLLPFFQNPKVLPTVKDWDEEGRGGGERTDMRAVVLDGHLRFVRDYPIPEAPPGWARIRVRLAGICGTDMELIKGYRGFKGSWAMSSWGW